MTLIQSIKERFFPVESHQFVFIWQRKYGQLINYHKKSNDC